MSCSDRRVKAIFLVPVFLYVPLRVQPNGPELPDPEGCDNLRLWPPAGGQPAAASLTDQLPRLRSTVPWNLYRELSADICTERRLGGSAEWGDKGRVDGVGWRERTLPGASAIQGQKKDMRKI